MRVHAKIQLNQAKDKKSRLRQTFNQQLREKFPKRPIDKLKSGPVTVRCRLDRLDYVVRVIFNRGMSVSPIVDGILNVSQIARHVLWSQKAKK